MEPDKYRQHVWLGRIILVLCCLFYALFAFRVSPFLLHDLANHLARAHVIERLLGGTSPFFEQHFEFHTRFSPYFLGDMILVGLASVFPLEFAGRVWVLLCIAVLPFAVWRYLAIRDFHRGTILVGVILSFYLATDWILLAGFMNYRAGLGLAFLTLTAWEWFLRPAATRYGHRARYLVYLAGLLSCYLIHLSSIFFVGCILGTTLAVRFYQKRIGFAACCATLLPIVVLALHHLSGTAVEVVLPDASSPFHFRSPVEKLEALGFIFVRFRASYDLIFAAMFAALIGLVLTYSWRAPLQPEDRDSVVELGAVSFVLLAAFFVLPVEVKNIYDIDVRALPFAALFTLFSALYLYDRAQLTASKQLSLFVPLAVAGIIALLNVEYLFQGYRPHQARLRGFLAAVDAIPERKLVFPIATVPDDGRVQTMLHAGALYTARREGFTPYIFSDNFGSPIPFFHYRVLPQIPSVFWYIRGEPVDLTSLLSGFDYLLVTKPFDPLRLGPRVQVTAVYENESAIVYRIEKGAMQIAPSASL